MKDIRTRQDLTFLIDNFYDQAIVHPEISRYFNDVVAQHFETHKVHICDFWDDLIFHGNKYKGNPMLVHLNMHAEKTLTPLAFKTWLGLWEKTINENFKGANADLALSKAQQIGALMQFKIEKTNP